MLWDSLVGGAYPDARGRFGTWGGRYVPETLVGALDRLTGTLETLCHGRLGR